MKAFAALLVLLICNNWQQLHGARILCLIATPEHNNPSWTQPFFEALAERGHLLTVVSTLADPSIPGITHIPVSNDYDVIKKHYVNEMGYYNNYWDIKQVLIWYEALLGTCQSAAEIDLVKMLEKVKHKYDLIIYDATYSMECLLSKFPKFRKVPVLALSGGKLTTDLMHLVQAENTINPATIPHFISHLPREMSHWQRIQNHVMYLTESFIRWAVVKPVLNGIHKHEYASPEVQLVLLNTHPVLDHVQNIPPNVIEVGGLHIRAESEPLSFSTQEFLERSSEGIIYINLPHIDLMYGVGLRAIENMVREYRQFGFLWNVNNVKDPTLSKSFHNLRTINVRDNMQQNILAQSNIKAFLTHGDNFGLQDAIYNAVPVIVLPLLMDQFNVRMQLKN
ncbi:GH10108 [Drosophila grimshawi]|uniref:GH10108 n=1 Tax=Drosophila grimshawi TaxID=7222 RepID=B4K0Z1_DROGR|nr:GH10108 [Drosophila grimshawi]